MPEVEHGPRGVVRELVRSRVFPQTPVRRILDRYQPRHVIGRGGAGVVLSAFDPTLERKVAIKVMQRRANPGNERRLLDEARLMARVHHPNVISVFDVGIDPDRDVVFVVMELVDGTSLADWLNGPHTLPQRLAMMQGVGQGLYAAHSKGVVHRDFKPQNVIIGTDGYPRVLDFGLASALLEPVDGARSAVTAPLGTPGYLSPEHWSGGPLDDRTDQFAFCLTLAQALANVELPVVWSAAELRGALRDLQRRITQAKIGRELEEAIMQGLAWERSQRFSSMRRLLRVLERVDPEAPVIVNEPRSEVYSARAWVHSRNGSKIFVWAPVGLPTAEEVAEDVRAFTTVARSWEGGQLEFRCHGLPRFSPEMRRAWESGLTDVPGSVLLRCVGAGSTVRMGLSLLVLSTGVLVFHEDAAGGQE